MNRQFCAIVDANSMSEVVRETHEATQILVKFLRQGRGTLHMGGKLREELEVSPRHKRWIGAGIARGWIKNIDNGEVERRTHDMKANRTLRSDDPHIIALAQVGGARLLVSRDVALGKDFKDREFLDNPRGKLLPFEAKTSSVQNFLSRTPLCTRRALRASPTGASNP